MRLGKVIKSDVLNVSHLDVHHAGEDGGELLLGGTADDGLLVRAVLRPQGRKQAHKHSQDVGPDLNLENVLKVL